MLRVEVRTGIDELDPLRRALREYGIRKEDVRSYSIAHRSMDLRPMVPAGYDWQIDLELENEKKYLRKMRGKARAVSPYRYALPEKGDLPLAHRPVVVGFGPAGMAAGMLLARMGYQPLILEQGPSIPERRAKVEKYWKTGVLDERGNVQFGEGGAGAFSDGKLTTRVKDPRVRVILEQLVSCGADPSILWMNHPHIGTDRLGAIDESVRMKILEWGGEVRFDTKMDSLAVESGRVCGLRTDKGEEIPCGALLLAIGHSSRDTLEMLHSTGVPMQAKPFAVGVRVEHLQEMINQRQYRNVQGREKLPAAEYHLSHTSSCGKGTYSFCMCPGGTVSACASERDTAVTNGMSDSKRSGANANSAIVVQVDSSDYGEGIFAGMEYQRMLERRAFDLGEGKAPCQAVENFLDPMKKNEISLVAPTYQLGVKMTDVHPLFSRKINDSLEEMFRYGERVIPGFSSGGAILTAVESRTSSPVRILRDPLSLESPVEGLYPAGEGAGYAGGIISSAIDGLKCAEKIVRRYSAKAESGPERE